MPAKAGPVIWLGIQQRLNKDNAHWVQVKA